MTQRAHKGLKQNKTKRLKQNPNCVSPFKSFEKEATELFKQNKMDITSTSYNLEKQIVKELKKAVSPSNITPNDDFYSYVNERWLKDLDVEAYQQYIVQVDDFRLVQDKVYRQLIQIIQELKPNTVKTKHIKNAYSSFQRRNTREETRRRAAEFVEILDMQLADEADVWKTLASANENEIVSWGSPFVWSINPDDKNPVTYKCTIEPPVVTLLDVDIYYDDKTDSAEEHRYKQAYRKKYFEYLERLFVAAFGENHSYNVKDVYDVEIQLLNAMACDIVKTAPEDDELGYNLISGNEAQKMFGFNWTAFCKYLGFKTVPREFITSNINYMMCGTKTMNENWKTPAWRTYWIYIYIRQLCRWSEDGWQNHYDFHGKFVRGQMNPVDAEIMPIFGMSFTFNTFLTNEYVRRYKNDQAVEYVKELAEDLRVVFTRIIQRNTWMDPSTKKIAIDKLNAIQLKVGSPSILREDPMLEYSSTDPWGNLSKMAKWRHKEAVRLVGKPVIDLPVIDWSEIPPKMVSTQAYVVNAMYTATENSIYIPLGYIQPPFVDLSLRGMEYNLAHIGFTIAHEMSHALDDWGSKYDKHGKLHNWWSAKDAAHFKRIQTDIVKQYETYAKRDGITFDAWPSIGEDLADISGFAICQEYLRDFQLKNQDILPIQSLSFETFFVYFALQSRQKISKRAIQAQLKTNPHPLDKYRCNVPLSRTRIFSALYGVKRGDGMWWSNFNSVWS